MEIQIPWGKYSVGNLADPTLTYVYRDTSCNDYFEMHCLQYTSKATIDEYSHSEIEKKKEKKKAKKI